jgi:hypothetical protein
MLLALLAADSQGDLAQARDVGSSSYIDSSGPCGWLVIMGAPAT